MRRIVIFDRVSADGYFAACDGNLNWVVPEEELEKDAAGGELDTILFGRRTYEQFESFWPNIGSDSPTAPDPHSPGKQSPEMRAIADTINNATKVVFSKTRKDVTWKNSRLMREFDPREIAAMKSQPGSDIMVFGSGSIVSQLTEHALVDEYQFVVSPILIGSGQSLISGVSKTSRLNLVECTKYRSGNVKLRYERAK